MKTTLLLAGSLVLNLGLAALYFTGRADEQDRPQPAPTARVSGSGKPVIDATVWPALQDSDLPTLIERLKASGFPPSIIRAIAAAQIREGFAERRRALRAASANQPFWKEIFYFDPKTYAAEQALYREEQKLMRQLFGTAGENDDPLRSLYENRNLSFLPAEKADAVRQLLRSFDEQRAEAFTNFYDREKATAIDKQQREALSRLLSPDELYEYDLRSSNTAQRLREELSAFQPTEEEYRAIFKLRQAFDDRFQDNYMPFTAPEQRQQRAEAERLLQEQIKAALAPARATDYERATDYNYRRAAQLIARLELPAENVNQLYTLQKAAEQQRNAIYQDNLPLQQRTLLLTDLQKETAAKVAPLVGGPQNLDVYKQYGGSWLDNMAPRQAPKPAPAAPAKKS